MGSTRGITDSTQATTDSVLYDAFGMTVSRTGTTPTPFGFVGGSQYQTDNDSGLMLLGNRYYDASIGRFISSDPAKAGTNWFAYCGNEPLTKTDAEGLKDQGDSNGAARFANCSDTNIRIVFDVDEPISTSDGIIIPILKRMEYYIDLPPGYTSTPKLDVDWVYDLKLKRWDHLWPGLGGTAVGHGDINYPHLPGNGIMGKGGAGYSYTPWPWGFGPDPITRPNQPPPSMMPPEEAIRRRLIKKM